nr:MAG: capsid protein [Skomarfal virus 15]
MRISIVRRNVAYCSMVKVNQNGGRGRKRNNGSSPRNGGNGMRNTRNNNNGAARVPLLPSGVNNKATMPVSAQDYTAVGEEVISVINVPAGSTPGTLVYNQLISPISAVRLGILSRVFQRIDWKQASLHLVALNGSLVQSGYTMGWLEDPSVSPPTDKSAVIPFLTALRSTTVRQAWVESTSGIQVNTPDKPEMYTQLGSDIRRYSPGRLMVAVAGDLGSAATFQLMLRYRCRLYVPMALGLSTPVSAIRGFTVAVPANNNIALSGTSLSYPGLGPILPPVTAGQSVVLTTPICAFQSATAPAAGVSAPPREVVVIMPGETVEYVGASATVPPSIVWRSATYWLVETAGTLAFQSIVASATLGKKALTWTAIV